MVGVGHGNGYAIQWQDSGLLAYHIIRLQASVGGVSAHPHTSPFLKANAGVSKEHIELLQEQLTRAKSEAAQSTHSATTAIAREAEVSKVAQQMADKLAESQALVASPALPFPPLATSVLLYLISHPPTHAAAGRREDVRPQSDDGKGHHSAK